MISEYFLDVDWLGKMATWIQKYYIIIAAFALVIGVTSLVRLHATKIRDKNKGWGFSLVTIIGLLAMMITGLGLVSQDPESNLPLRGTDHPANLWLYDHIQVPLGATMFSLLAFFIASAAYRAFRARSPEATLLLLSAIIVMLGQVPVGEAIWDGLPQVKDWLLDNINTASKRAIMMGVGLGMVSTALKIIFGIEKTYLGGGDG